MRVGYARVSTKDQNIDLQVDALTNAGCETVFQEVASGAKTARPVLSDMLSRLRSGDVLVIWKLDRLGRSLKHLVTLTNELLERKIGLISLNDPIDTTTPQGRLVFNIFASLAEFERDLIRERDWDYSSLAFGVPKEKREALRKAVIAEYGKKLELIAPKGH